MAPDLAARIDRMFLLDRLWAWSFVVALWLVVGFVFLAISPLIEGAGIRAALIVSGLAVLAFNTAAIAAMVRHYADDKAFIYGLDIRHLDERRRLAAGGLARQPAE